MVDDTRRLYADIAKQLADMHSARGIDPVAERMASAASPQPVRNPFSGTGVRNPSAAAAWLRGSGVDVSKGVNVGLHPDVAQAVVDARRLSSLSKIQPPMAPEVLPDPPNWARPWTKPAGSGAVIERMMQGQMPQEAARFPSGQHWSAMSELGREPIPPRLGGIGGQVTPEMRPKINLPMVRDPGFTMGGGSGAGGAERYARPIGPQEMRLLEGPKTAAKATAGALGARALMGKAASMYTPAAVAAGLTGSAMDLFDPESDVRTWGAPARADFYRDLNEGNYLRAAGDFARANLMSGAAVAKNVAGAVLPIGPALDVLAGLVGGQRAQAQEVPEAQLPEQNGFILRNDNIPEEARLNGGLNFVGTVGPGGSQVTAEDIQGAYDRLNKQNRLAQVMDSLSGPQQREMLAYGAKQQRPMSWSDKLSQQLAGAIAANVAEQLQAEKDPAKRNAIKRQGLLELSRLAGRGNVQLENIGALPMMQED